MGLFFKRASGPVQTLDSVTFIVVDKSRYLTLSKSLVHIIFFNDIHETKQTNFCKNCLRVLGESSLN